MTEYVLDASAVLALLFSEPGKDRVEQILEDCVIDRVNATEILTKLVERGASLEEAVETLADLRIPIFEFEVRQSEATAELRRTTKHLGLSLGDRACLALAVEENAVAVTADKNWGNVAGYKVEVIR